MAKITEAQTQLLETLTPLMGNQAIPYENIKRLAEVKSFDSSFNALLKAGYFQRINTNDFSNQFVRTNKK